MRGERLTEVDGFGTLDRHVYMTPMWDTTYTASPTQYLFCPVCVTVYESTIHTSSPFSLLSRYIRMYIPSLRRQLSRRQDLAALFVCRGLSPRSSNLRNHFVSTDPLLACRDLHGPHTYKMDQNRACISRVGNYERKKTSISFEYFNRLNSKNIIH